MIVPEYRSPLDRTVGFHPCREDIMYNMRETLVEKQRAINVPSPEPHYRVKEKPTRARKPMKETKASQLLAALGTLGGLLGKQVWKKSY